MPTFATPEPITLTLEVAVGDIRIVASERDDTVVEVRPTDPAKDADVAAAERTRVEFASGRLLIKTPKSLRRFSLRGPGESIDVEISLPAGSQLRGETGVARLHCTGRLGESRYTAGVGDVALDATGPLVLKTGAGEVAIEHVAGDAHVSTGAGAVRIGRIDGAAVIKNANGDTALGDVAGELRVNAANGRITVGALAANGVVKTANGEIELGEVASGSVVAQTAYGKVGVGIRSGVAAYLDLNTGFGNVVNDLDAAGGPEAGDETVEVKVRSGFGDISIRRGVVAA